MRTRVKLPKLSETGGQMVVLSIAVSAGQLVAEGDTLLHVETDKVEADVPSPVAGRVVEILVAEDDEISVGTPIVVLDA
jgi:Pyruvate/2-oxoglutarate dehydrogenase complex, dihydrolipoamide acyltransferase (E2) component, and related enzymes